MRVKMVPHWLNVMGHSESGIKTTIDKYFKYLPDAGITLVDSEDENFDVLAVHAGMTRNIPYDTPVVSHNHGLYWTADYTAASWEYKSNRDVIESIRVAREITVPTSWVAETFRRDMHVSPHVVPHGIDWWEWEHKQKNEGFILWNKNRGNSDVCDPGPVRDLAMLFPGEKFVSTFLPDGVSLSNAMAIGIQPHVEMRFIVQRAGVYLATTKETFGIGILEAMASGVPVLGYNHGGVSELIKHGETGYLAQPGNLDDLAQGLAYCLQYRDTLGENARVDARQYSWSNVASQLGEVYRLAARSVPDTVSVVIPCYNKEATLERAVMSAMRQSIQPLSIVIVDDGSVDSSAKIGKRLSDDHENVEYIYQENKGVAHARNTGVRATTSTYVCCLDADDEIAPKFLKICVDTLVQDPTVGVAYTKLRYVSPDGNSTISQWPGDYNYDDFLCRKNQVPTCAVYRRDLFNRLGGYRQRYAPLGAGAEDAEFWLRMGASGYSGRLVTGNPLFLYHGGGQTSNAEYRETDWLSWHPWTKDDNHPFASVATPVQFAHPVRQYDAPYVSVIIPCGENHKDYLIDALDSLEAQGLRQWEAIVICDGFSVPAPLQAAYPFVRWVEVTQRGPGAARNLGVSMARAERILFLDADDWLAPGALSTLASECKSDTAAYSDYFAIAKIDDPLSLASDIKLIDTNSKTGFSLLQFSAAEFDRTKALNQPENPPYIWCNITTMISKSWHEKIGGFNEKLASWEDVDYWWRMARAGLNFTHIKEPLMVYRIATGQRRELGHTMWFDLLAALKESLENG